jgi:hypothetical protein
MRRSSSQPPDLSPGALICKPARALLLLGMAVLSLITGPAAAQLAAHSGPVLLAQAGAGAESNKNSAQPANKSRKPQARKPVKRSAPAARKASAPRPPASAPTTQNKPAVAAAAAGAAGALAAPALFASGSEGPQGLSMAAPGTGELTGVPPQPLTMQVGLYQCDLNRRVEIRSMAADRSSMVIAWLGREHTMTGVDSATGALRYENPDAGLTFLIIVGKAMLLDSHKGQQLANECRL